MNINNIYISDDIIHLIFINLNLKSKLQFSQSNKFIYQKYGGDNLKKYKIYHLINNDYLEFYQYLQDYKYTINEINEFLKISLKEIPTVWINSACGFYDMKYIFELLFINQNNLLPDSEIKKLNLHFHIHFYSQLINCLRDSRKETKEHVFKCIYLRPLRNDFKGYYKNKKIYQTIV